MRLEDMIRTPCQHSHYDYMALGKGEQMTWRVALGSKISQPQSEALTSSMVVTAFSIRASVKDLAGHHGFCRVLDIAET